MNRQNMDQESQELDDDVELSDTETVIPARLLRKLKRIPRLADLEKMFDEPSNNEDNNNDITSNLLEQGDSISNNTEVPRNLLPRMTPEQNVTDHDQTQPPPFDLHRRRRCTPSHTITSNTTRQCNNSMEDADNDDENEDSNEHHESDNPVSPSNLVNSPTVMMEQILKRAFISLKRYNDAKFSNATSPNGNPTDANIVVVETVPETPTTSSDTTEPQEIQITCGSSHNHINIGNVGSITTRHVNKHGQSNKRYISVKRLGNTDSRTNNEKYMVEHVDRITCNVMRNRQRRTINKPDNPAYVCNIAYLNKCGQSRKKYKATKVRSTSKAKSTKTKPTSKDKKFGDCPVCMDKLNSTNLRVVHCGHVFCLRCIQYIFLKGDKKCPTCRTVLESYGYHKLYL